MGIKEAIAKVTGSEDLDMDEASAAMEDIVQGRATHAQIAGLAVALRMKGETAGEIAGLARVMRSRALHVPASGELLDTCGTGGDGLFTFNISTIAAFVACGAGARVAKHGGRAASSRCGSADLLESLGVAIELTPEEVATCIEEVGIGFMFAPMFHPGMKQAAGPRKELGIRTVFNILGPLTNPADARNQLLGVATEEMVPMMGEVLSLLGCRRALVVHGSDGMDEISISGPTTVCEVRDGTTRNYTIQPEDFGLTRHPLETASGAGGVENAEIASRILAGARGPRRDVVLLNAAAALYCAGKVESLKEGVAVAAESIDSGAAAAKLAELRTLSQALVVRRASHVS